MVKIQQYSAMELTGRSLSIIVQVTPVSLASLPLSLFLWHHISNYY